MLTLFSYAGTVRASNCGENSFLSLASARFSNWRTRSRLVPKWSPSFWRVHGESSMNLFVIIKRSRASSFFRAFFVAWESSSSVSRSDKLFFLVCRTIFQHLDGRKVLIFPDRFVQ